MSRRGRIIRLPPDRVWRAGPGDRTLRVARTHCGGPVRKEEKTFLIAIVTAGTAIAEVDSDCHLVHTYEMIFLPAGGGPVRCTPVNGPAEILEGLPPA